MSIKNTDFYWGLVHAFVVSGEPGSEERDLIGFIRVENRHLCCIVIPFLRDWELVCGA